MRKLILFMHTSLDGYVAASDEDGTGRDRTVSTPDEDPGALDTVVPALINDADTLLLGRPLADDLLGYWLNAEANDPGLTEGGIAYARWTTEARKAVLSNAQETLPWPDTELLLVRSDADMTEAINALKQRPGKNIVCHGGVRTAQRLARLGLIDEYQLVVAAVALGDGRPLFKDLPDHRLKLDLLDVQTLDAGGIFLRYQPAT